MSAGTQGDRILCARCGANNFTGKSQCWQCAAPLAGTSPGARPIQRAAAQSAVRTPLLQQVPQQWTGTAQSPQEAARSAAFVQKWGMSPGVAALVVAVGLGMFLVVWIAAGRIHNGSEVGRPAPQAPTAVATPASNETESARQVIGEDDPLVAESKRLIDHETRHAGIEQTPVSADGRVHLRGGGSISPEQYRDAQRRVNDSPVIRSPTPPPPMP